MEHVPVPSTVTVPASMAHGPLAFNVTGFPDRDAGVNATELPAVSAPTLPGPQAAEPAGVTVIVSAEGAGWTFTDWESVSEIEKFAEE